MPRARGRLGARAARADYTSTLETMRVTRRLAFSFRSLRSPAVVVVVTAGVYVLMLAALQRQMIYYPMRADAAALAAEATALRMAPWRDAQGRAHGWVREGDAPDAPRLVVFHGNAGYALHRGYFADGFAGWQVFLFEYPGYGARDGEPSAESIKQAAGEALESLLAADKRPLFLLGESLGSGVACETAAAHPHAVAGLVLVTPFTTLEELASHHYPWLPVSLLLTERYDCVGPLRDFRGPIAVVLAGRDEIVPVALGRRLYETYAGPKYLHEDARAGHNSIDYDPRRAWWAEIAAFLLRGGET